MKIFAVLLLGCLLAFVPAVVAKRVAPKKVPAVVHDGVRFEAPNRSGRVVKVEAWDETTGQRLWECVVHEVAIDPKLEEDVQWDFIAGIRFEKSELVIVTESGQEYRLDPATRSVRKVVAEKKPAGSTSEGLRQPEDVSP
jgi:acyl-CoA hydrolase